MSPVACLLVEFLLRQKPLERVDLIHDKHCPGDCRVVELLLGQLLKIGVLELYLLFEISAAEVLVVVVFVVNLDEESSFGIRRVHGGDIDLGRTCLLLLEEGVAAGITSVDIELHRPEARRPGHAHQPRDALRDGIAEQGAVLDVGEQYPVAVAAHPEHFVLGLELHAIRILQAPLGVPRSVAAAPDLHRYRQKSRVGVHLRRVLEGNCPDLVVVLVGDCAAIARDYVDAGEVGQFRDGVVGRIIRHVLARVVPAPDRHGRDSVCGCHRSLSSIRGVGAVASPGYDVGLVAGRDYHRHCGRCPK